MKNSFCRKREEIMNLVKIDGIYINVDRIDGLSVSYLHGNPLTDTNIFVGGSQRPFIVEKNIDEVATIIGADKGVREE